MMRTRHREAGISMILVVVLILLALILTAVSAGIWADWKAKDRTNKALQEELALLQSEEAYYATQIPKLNRATGFDLVEQRFSHGKPVEYLRGKRDEYFSEAALEMFPMDNPQKIKAEDAPRLKDARELTTLYDTLQALVPLAAQRMYHMQNKAKALELELDIASEQRDNREKAKPEIIRKKPEEKQKLLDEIAKVQKQITEENETFNARKALLTEAKTKADEEAMKEAEKWIEEERTYLNQTRELKRQLEELKVREVIKHEISFVHGKIVRPDIPNKSAFITIGSRERVVPGLKFLVGRRGMKGRFEFKGKIEVKKVWTEYSEVSIIELNNSKERPIVDGDAIVNPLFRKDRPVVVAFVGEERPLRLRYSVDEASRRLKEIGSEARKTVDLDIDYVIFTESASGRARDHYDAYQRAVLLEIPIAEAGRTKEDPEVPGLFEFLGD